MAPRLPEADHPFAVRMVGLEISRFPHKELTYMPGSSTTPGRRDTCASVPRRFAFLVYDRVGTQNDSYFAAQWLACSLPCQRFACPLTGTYA